MRILSSDGFPAVVFVPTDFIGRTNIFDAGIEPVEAVCHWNDLVKLEKAGISVQSHSASHPRFSQLDGAGQERELRLSKLTLESGLGGPITAFAYPFGDCGSDSEKMRSLMISTGYKAAFLYGGGVFQANAVDRFHLPRIAMGPDTDLLDQLRTQAP